MSHGMPGPTPRITAHTHPDGTGELWINTARHRIAGPTIEQTRAEIIRIVRDEAGRAAAPLQVHTEEPDGRWTLLVHPTGAVEEKDFVAAHGAAAPGPARVGSAPPAPSGAAAAGATPTPIPAAPPPPASSGSASTAPISAVPVIPQAPPPAQSQQPQQSQQPPQPPMTARPTGESVPTAAAPATAGDPAQPGTLTDPGPVQTPAGGRRRSFLDADGVEEPASKGWRGIATRIGFRMEPGKAERAARADAHVVAQHWPGKRTISVVNGKGGAGKTPTTVLTAATFARYGGSGVLAWDNNQTRGTLGWRSEKGPHDATLHELLPEAERLLGAGAQAADLARFVHRQTRDRFDVLRSKPMVLADEQRIDSDDVDAIHAIAAKYYRLIVMDSGNDESDPMWRRMIDHTDQLVVATTTRTEHAEAGALLLEALARRNEQSARLAAGAVVVVSQADPKATASDLRDIARGYESLAREVVTVPYDPGMGADLLHIGGLHPRTQRAWLAATAAVARGL